MIRMMITALTCAFLFELAFNSWQHTLNDLALGLIIIVVGLTPTICWQLGKLILNSPKHLWDENRDATKLAKKANKLLGLTEIEQNRLNRYVKEGILTATLCMRKGKVQPYFYLSNETVKNVLQC